MEKMASINWPDLHLIFLLTVCALLPNSAADQHYLGHYCPDDAIFAPDNQYGNNLNTLLASLSSNAAEDPRGFFEKTENDTVYGLYLCRGDLNTSSCSDCVSTATSELPQKCPNRAEAIIWHDGCTVRYSNKSFFGKAEVVPGLLLLNPQNFTDNNATMAQFADAVWELTRNASSQAAMGGSEKKLSTVSYNFSRLVTLYSLAQCVPDLSQNDCDHCLTSAIFQLPAIRKGGRILLPSCGLRYEIYLFFNDLDAAPTGGISASCKLGRSARDCNESASPPVSSASHARGGATKKVVAISVSISLSVFIIVFSGFCVWRRMTNSNSRKIPKFDTEEIRTAEYLQFDLQTIKAATQNFSRDNKLGCGGFGEVYKGVLEGGEEIKRVV